MTVLTTVGAVLGVVVAILGIAAIAALIWAKFRTDADERTLLLWKGEAEAQKARADRLEVEFTAYRTETTAKIADLTRRLEQLESENMARFREEIAAAFKTLPCALVAQNGNDSLNNA